MAPDLRFLPHCFVVAAASKWCQMECRIAQHCSSQFWRESDYMQASVLGPVSVDGGSLVHGNCTADTWLSNIRRWSRVINAEDSCNCDATQLF